METTISKTGLLLTLIVLLCRMHRTLVNGSKLYSGQRIFTDTRIIDFFDPAKHGFHIVLNERFVDTYLQPIRLPTVFATAIALRHRPPANVAGQVNSDKSSSSSSSSLSASAAATSGLMSSTGNVGQGWRVTKVLYPENVSPDDGLLDGRTIKLVGLRERSWYYVCVEFESNLNRHEVATGLSCQMKRTLDKFGNASDTTVTELDKPEITDRSITIGLTVDAEFPLRLTAYLSQDGKPNGDVSPSVPAQTFVVSGVRQHLRVSFDRPLQPDTDYGRFCVLEEPVSEAVEAYTAMGRAVRQSLEHCHFENLRTEPSPAAASRHHFQMQQHPRHIVESSYLKPGSGAVPCHALLSLVLMSLGGLLLFR